MLDSLTPTNYLEELLADRAALATWRLRRAARYERGILARSQIDAEQAAGDALSLYCRGGQHIATLEDAAKEAMRWRDATVFVEQLAEVNADLESQLENEVLFSKVLEIAAGVAGIALERHEDDGECWYELPGAVYERDDSLCDYWPALSELRDGLEAIAAHSSGATLEEITEQTLAALRDCVERADEQKAKLESAVALEREKRSLPMDKYGRPDDALLARYETAAERTLERSLTSLRLLRDGLGSVGKTGEAKKGTI
ncbi:MAG: hypothetical protein ACP5O6_06285 [Candidatus Baltobacteraceae bacterium]